jgi:hypothetical protein
MATAGEAKTEPEAERMVAGPLREQLDRWLTAGVMNPWCSLCRAPRANLASLHETRAAAGSRRAGDDGSET